MPLLLLLIVVVIVIRPAALTLILLFLVMLRPALPVLRRREGARMSRQPTGEPRRPGMPSFRCGARGWEAGEAGEAGEAALFGDVGCWGPVGRVQGHYGKEKAAEHVADLMIEDI
jgi:hypothetical protein